MLGKPQEVNCMHLQCAYFHCFRIHLFYDSDSCPIQRMFSNLKVIGIPSLQAVGPNSSERMFIKVMTNKGCLSK